ncbi:MAG: zinc-ribbon domain-containing protein [Deltaproteobacteria bacterium]|nr:zinc-ribbon domain-containing protein [Deltaproteobacteria bacterium]
MKVVCDNCRAVYKIPDEKLVKPVNKATCRNCGHRMLIPRPRKDADPEERTLVTAVPPTPAPAPGRAKAPVEDDQTLPGRFTPPGATPDPMERYGTPALSKDRSFDPGGIAPAADGPRPASPTTQSESPRTQPPVPPQESMSSSSAPTQVQLHPDPAGDMVLALLGAVGAITGAFILGLVPATTPGVGGLALVVVGIGLVISMTGGFLAVLVILTGARGRRKASRFMSFAAASVLGVLVALLVSGALPFALSGFASSGERVAAGTPDVAMPERGQDPPEEPAPAEPVAAPKEAAPARPVQHTPPARVASPPRPEPAEPARVSTPSEPPVVVRVAPSAPARTQPSAPAAPARVAPPPQDDLAFLNEPDELDLPDESFQVGSRGGTSAPPSAPPAAAVESPSMDVIDIILRNNVDIKRCFFAHMKAVGSLPSNVKVRFTVEPSGAVSAAGITDREFQGSELDRCLSRTIRGLTFPEFNGPPSKVTYPFVL